MALGHAKMKKWKKWEAENGILTVYLIRNQSRCRLASQTSFVKQYSGVSGITGVRWIVAVFRQFFKSVTKVDYLTMRRGFINFKFFPLLGN
ncbi:MLO protein like 1 [Apostasia shenzhenica]|uniref:MLO protein like 1 n=1 Tax=Apostasia shenzhenica TaxID=1088818 RepID=A0A2I0AB40_9ASPA|nr:MLO protein like 1 [Apostasia shenzhenica]